SPMSCPAQATYPPISSQNRPPQTSEFPSMAAPFLPMAPAMAGARAVMLFVEILSSARSLVIGSSRGLALARRIEAARLSSLGLGAVMTRAPRRSSWYCGAPARPGRRAPLFRLFRLGQAQLFQGRLLVGGQLRHERLVVCGTHVAAHEVEL